LAHASDEKPLSTRFLPWNKPRGYPFNAFNAFNAFNHLMKKALLT
jgi:hypothetical protein